MIERLEGRQLLAADVAALGPAPLEPDLCSCPVCQGLLGLEPAESALMGGIEEAPLSSLPQLSSLPGATAKLFLDFDGHFEASWSFRTNVTTPAYDQDGDPSSFSTGELNSIQEIWARVAEDYAPFNIDVTTIDPGHQTDRVVAVVAIGGHYSDWYGSASGGVAFVGGFSNFSPNVGYVFSKALGNSPRSVAEASSHEAGHLFGLSHQARWNGSTLAENYHSGNGAWAPIMGQSYSATRSTWHNGTTSASPTSIQDDMAIISGATNGFGYKTDDFGSTRQTASALPVTGSNVSFTGLIERNNDQDVWSFTTSGGAVSFTLVGAPLGTNLDGVLELWNASGDVVVTHSPANSLGAQITTTLTAGTYYLAARGTGEYGNVGQYRITGSLSTSTDTTPPSADLVDVAPDPRNTAVTSVSVTFSEPVTGVDLADFALTRSGTPVALGGASLSGSGSVYTLNLNPAATASAGSYVLRLVAGGSGIMDLAGNPLAADASDSWTTDVTAPAADIVDVTPDPRTAAVGLATINFTEPVSGFDLADLTLLRDGSPVALPAGSLSGSGSSYSLNLAGVTGTAGSYQLRVSAIGSEIRDAAGNLLAADAVDSWVVDPVPPTADIVDVAPDPRSTSVGLVTIAFSEPVSGFDRSDLQLRRDGAVVSLASAPFSGNGATYTIDLTALTSFPGSYELRLVAAGSNIVDAAGNGLAAGASDTWLCESAAPVASITPIVPSPRNTSVGAVSIWFSEPVTGVDQADFVLTHDGSPMALPPGALSGGGADYSLDLSGLAQSDGTYVLTLAAAGSQIVDMAGNLLAADASDSWLIDTVGPQVDILDVAPDPRNSAVTAVSLQFSEPVTGIDLGDLELTRNGVLVSLVGAVVSGDGSLYSIDLGPLASAEGDYVLHVRGDGSGIADAAGNLLASPAEDSWRIDTTQPAVNLAAVTPSPRSTPVGSVAITFSEPVSGFDLADLALWRDGASVPLSAVGLSGSGAVYSVDLSSVAASSGEYELRVVSAGSGVVDAAGNSLLADGSRTWTIDMTAPAADIVDVSPDPRNGSVAAVSVAFSEPVTGVDISDFVLTRNGDAISLAGVTVLGSGTSYSLDLSSVSGLPGSYTLTLVAAGSGIQDAVGNALAAGASDHWVVDISGPVADILDVSPDPRNGPVSNVTIRFSKPVTGVDAGDFRLWRNGQPMLLVSTQVSGSGDLYTLDLSEQTQEGGAYELQLISAGSEIVDTSGNPLAQDASDAWFSDRTTPTAGILDVTPNVRNVPIGVVTITFSEPVSGVGLEDFRLLRDETPVSLASVAFQGAGSSYSLDLSAFALAGTYRLELVAEGSEIADQAGNLLASGTGDGWVIDTTGPAAQFENLPAGTASEAVGEVMLTFSEPVTGVNLNDFLLTHDGQAVSLDNVPFRRLETAYALDLSSLTQAAGAYELRLVSGGSGIADLAGNPLLDDVVGAWVTVLPAALETNPWHNPVEALDVDGQSGVTALDALAVINEINSRRFSDPRTGKLVVGENGAGAFYDVNDDEYVSATDCLMIINALNAAIALETAIAPEMAIAPKMTVAREPVAVDHTQTCDLWDVLAMDVASRSQRRQR